MKLFEGIQFSNPFVMEPLVESKPVKPKAEEYSKIALIVDTNILLKKVHVRDLLRVD